MSTQNLFSQNPFAQAFKTSSDLAGSYAAGAGDKFAANPFNPADALATAAQVRQSALKNYQTLTNLSKSAADFVQAAGRCSAEFAHRQAEVTSEYVQQISSLKNPSEALAKHSQFVCEYAGAVVANAKEISDMAVRFGGEAVETVGGRVSEALEEVSGLAVQHTEGNCASKKKNGFGAGASCASSAAHTSYAA